MEDEMTIEDWGMEEKPKADESLKQLLIAAAEYKTKLEQLEAEIESYKKPYNALCETIQKTLELMEVKKMSAQGYDFKLEEKSSVKTPKTIEEKQALFAYLETLGLGWEIFSVNSMTLNSTYKSLAEQALKEGDLDFELPGVGKATSYTTLKIKKGK